LSQTICWQCGVKKPDPSMKYCSPVCDELASGKDIWRHYKGQFYRVITVARLESDPNVQMVVYCSFNRTSTWVRPLNEFMKKFTAEYSRRSV
jgi:hypothetical protein